MLDDLSSYSLSDFLLFSQETYFRLFERMNEELWPLHVAALAALGIAYYALRMRSSSWGTRSAAALLALAWAWVGWDFHLGRFTPINIIAPYYAALFGLEAAVLVAVGVLASQMQPADGLAPKVGSGMMIYAAVVHPVFGLVAGRAWTELAFFGLAPDPTAIATLGAALLVAGWARWLVLVPPVLWCIISALTAAAMDSVEALPTALAGATAIVLSFWRSRN